ncbi:S26 family signal peptidase [Candidatus Saccharibacteria bacterium]|nr:MAG: S26 family signal peptidase [Candidatus Saccharibacteria bacterium]
MSQESKRRTFILIRRVVGKSMWPVLDPEQVVIAVRKRQYEPEDVVVISHRGREKIKRIHKVEGGKYDVRGDNLSQSTDSRHFGPVAKEDILGKVVWPRV